jgi:hypothetical protein
MIEAVLISRLISKSLADWVMAVGILVAGAIVIASAHRARANLGQTIAHWLFGIVWIVYAVVRGVSDWKMVALVVGGLLYIIAGTMLLVRRKKERAG